MKCDFCGEDLPIVFAAREADAATAIAAVEELCPVGRYVYDADDHVVYEYFAPRALLHIDGYRHLCSHCADKLSDYYEKLLGKHDSMREAFIRNAALNTIRKHRGAPTAPYLVTFDLDIEEHPVAQIFKKTDGSYRLCNQLDDEAAGTLLKYMEG